MLARSELVPVTVAAAFTCGLVLALAQRLREPLARRLGLGAKGARRLPMLAALALVPAAVLAGGAIDRWGVEWVLVGGSLASALSIAGLALAQQRATALAVVAVLGAAAAVLGVSANVLMPTAFFPDRPVAAVNLGNGFFVLGLLVAPVLADALLERLGFRRTVGLFALFCLTPALAAALVPAAFPTPAVGPSSLDLDNPLLIAACLAFFLYGPLEGVLGLWTAAYLTDLGYSERRSAWLVTGFWLTFLAGRLLTALALQAGAPHPALEAGGVVVLVLLTAVALGNLAGTTSRVGAASSVLLAGLFLGPIFPTLLGLVFPGYPESERGSVVGLLLACGGLGSVLLLPLLDACARRATVQRAMRLPTLAALLLAAATLGLALLLAGGK